MFQLLGVWLSFSIGFASGNTTLGLSGNTTLGLSEKHVALGNTTLGLSEKHVASGNTTLGLSERHVIQALKALGEVGKIFPVLDFYKSLISNGTDVGKRYANIYELARLNGLHGGDLFSTEPTTEVSDWLADLTEDYDNSDDVAQKVADLVKSNQSVVDYYLKRTTRRKLSESEMEVLYEKAWRLADKKYTDSSETTTEIHSNRSRLIANETMSRATVTTGSAMDSTRHCFQEHSNANQSQPNRFIQKLKKIAQLFKKSTKPQQTTTHTKNQLKTKILKYWKSKIWNPVRRYYSDIRKTRREMFMAIGIKPVEFDLVKRIRQFFQRNKTTPKRHRRDVCDLKGEDANSKTDANHENSPNSKNKSSGGIRGLFQRIKNTFWKSKRTDPKSHEVPKVDDLEAGTGSPSETNLSKFSKDHFIQPPSGLFSFKRNELDRLNTCSTVESALTSVLVERGKENTLQYANKLHKTTQKADTLLENAKKFIQRFYNTSETMVVTKMNDFIAGLSTKSGQKWWEALHDNNESDETSEEATECDLEKTKSSFGNSVESPVMNVQSPCMMADELKSEPDKLRHVANKHSHNTRTFSSRYDTFDRAAFDTDAQKADTMFPSQYSRMNKNDSVPVPEGAISTSTKPHIFMGSQDVTTVATIFHLDGRTFYRTQSAVFTYQRKPRTTQTTRVKSHKSEEFLFVTDDSRLNLNETWDYEHFCEFMRSTLCPEYRVFFTDTFTTRGVTQPTIKKSLFDRIKRIFRGGKSSAEVHRNKTESEEDFDHFKYLQHVLETKGNITHDEFYKRRLGNIHAQWSSL